MKMVEKFIRYILVSFALTLAMTPLWAKKPVIAPSYAWTMLPPLGLHQEATIDTTLYNYFQNFIPSERSLAWACTGNYGAEGINMIYFDRQPQSSFFFRDAISTWLPPLGNHKFYNTRIPMTLLSYNTGGGSTDGQDRLNAIFSGNTNAKFQVGAMLDYIYSKGSYDNQAAKNLEWGLSSSYMGDRYEMQAFFNHFNSLNKENGGITDDLYITNPALLQGGTPTISPKNIPTRLSAAHSRVRGTEFFVNNRYKVGYWHSEYPTDSAKAAGDTLVRRTYIPVSSFIWTLNYVKGVHKFHNTDASEAEDFWSDFYLSRTATHDQTSYWSLRNTFGVSLLEGFNKYAKFGLAAYLIHEVRRYNQTTDSIPLGEGRPALLTPYPFSSKIDPHATQNLLWVGGQLTKQTGSILRYEATACFGLIGAAAGDIHAQGTVSTRFPLWGDSLIVRGNALFANEMPPYLMNNYVSNHFIWHNDFGKTRRLRLGGDLKVGRFGTILSAGVENVQNLIYFGENCLPTQASGSVQVLNVALQQDFRLGILNWRNKINYQTSSNESVLSLPKLSLYSNLYILFRVARVLHVQLGVDCDYYTRYYAPGYQPATMSFYNQRSIMLGNYPFMNAYINMKLSKARFYVMMTHVNQGLFGDNYFSLPHYPLNPRRFQLGVSVDFAN